MRNGSLYTDKIRKYTLSVIEEHEDKSSCHSQTNKAKLKCVTKDEAGAVLAAVKVGSHGLINLVSGCIISVTTLWNWERGLTPPRLPTPI